MSKSWAAMAVIGVRLDEDDLYDYQEVPNCEHDIPPAAHFCPMCGAKAGTTETKKLKPCVVTKYRDEETLCDATIGGLKVWRGYDDNDILVVGVGVQANDYDNNPARADVPVNAREECLLALEPLGLWNPDNFGLWAILY